VQKGRQKFARKLAPKTGTKIAQKIEKKAPIAHLLVAAGKTAPKVARSATTAIMARNFHAKHEATHPQRPPHEKRRVAEETFMQRVNVPA
jgi:hypothetical protein